MSETSTEMAEFGAPRLLGRRMLNREQALEAWVVLLSLGAAGFCAALVGAGFRVSQPAALCLLAALALAAEHEGIRITPNVEVTIASLVCVFAAVVLGPVSGAVVALVGLLRDLPRRDADRPILRWATWTSIRVIATSGAGLAALAVGLGH